MSHPLDTFMILVSAVGQVSLWLALGGVGLLCRRMRPVAFGYLCLAMFVAFLVADLTLKPLVHAPRPFDAPAHLPFIGPRPSGYSFPSGHAASSFAAAVALSCGWPAGTIAWFALAALVACSRVYLGVHYPIDVVAGGLVGLARSSHRHSGNMFRNMFGRRNEQRRRTTSSESSPEHVAGRQARENGQANPSKCGRQSSAQRPPTAGAAPPLAGTKKPLPGQATGKSRGNAPPSGGVDRE